MTTTALGARSKRTIEEKRARLRVGATKTIRYGTGTTVRATVIEHTRGGVIVGVHPDMLCIPYEAIVAIGCTTWREV